MEITIHPIRFDMGEKLEAFIQKKVKRFAKIHDDAAVADITLKVIKPETNHNKEAEIKLLCPGKEFFAKEVADTFEEAILSCVDKIERQVLKWKEKKLS
ncbi:MAG: HPF/RaiA family ribosome-associated protein [Candidatus Symbiothrix sp.]|jgi:putative sigma-54 modulation protein|nr:HPF/RaiA family ribosome-associated protein [Candidatus Symbiothrix sp.]